MKQKLAMFNFCFINGTNFCFNNGSDFCFSERVRLSNFCFMDMIKICFINITNGPNGYSARWPPVVARRLADREDTSSANPLDTSHVNPSTLNPNPEP